MGDFRDRPRGSGNLGELNSGGATTGVIESIGDRDIFEVQLIEGLRYVVEQQGVDGGEGTLRDPHLFLVDVANDTLADNDDFGSLDSRIDYVADATGPVYLSAREFGNDETGTYLVSVSAGRGTRRDDLIVGTETDDAVRAGRGDDTISGRDGDDELDGDDGDNSVSGGRGDDALGGNQGEDVLRGQGGDDVLLGGFQADQLIGGRGGDTFVFRSVSASLPGAEDRISAGNGSIAFSFDDGDRIDVADIDADTTQNGTQSLAFGGLTERGKGFLFLRDAGDDTLVRVNTDDDRRAEMEIFIEDADLVTASDYRENDFFL